MEEIKTQLPENAFRELKEGEEYEPLMTAKMNRAFLINNYQP